MNRSFLFRKTFACCGIPRINMDVHWRITCKENILIISKCVKTVFLLSKISVNSLSTTEDRRDWAFAAQVPSFKFPPKLRRHSPPDKLVQKFSLATLGHFISTVATLACRKPKHREDCFYNVVPGVSPQFFSFDDSRDYCLLGILAPDLNRRVWRVY